MKSVADKTIRLTMVLVLACTAGIAYAQNQERREPPASPGGQTSGMPNQGEVEGMRGGQGSMGQMT